MARDGEAVGDVSRTREGGVQSVERVLDILEFLSRSEEELGIGEIGDATGLAAGTAHRLLATLSSTSTTWTSGWTSPTKVRTTL